MVGGLIPTEPINPSLLSNIPLHQPHGNIIIINQLPEYQRSGALFAVHCSLRSPDPICAGFYLTKVDNLK
jgi:hypothetical protein